MVRYCPRVRSPLVNLFLVSLLVVGGPSPLSAGNKQAKMPPATERTAREATLRQGMPAADVLRIMGKPNTVEPMEAPTGKAEVWSWVTRTPKGQNRYEIGSRPITNSSVGADGVSREAVIGQEIIYGTERLTEVRTYQILMFNDHFLNDKVSVVLERKVD